jgi:hypothetical protein
LREGKGSARIAWVGAGDCPQQRQRLFGPLFAAQLNCLGERIPGFYHPL